MSPFRCGQTVKLTSGLTSQTVVISASASTIVVYNAGANPVHLAHGATVAVPTATPSAVLTVAPGSTQSFDVSDARTGTSLSYIAETAGGLLYISWGEGA